MAKITVKRSSVEGKVPLTTDLDLGEFAVNTYDGKLFLKRDNGISQYIVEVGGNQGFYVKNQTGSSISKGTLVGFVGTVGSSGKLLIAPFLANGTTPSEYFMGVVSETIPDGGDGFVIDHGTIYNLNTSAWAASTVLYASATTAGAFTSTMPAAPNNKITVAAVVNSHSSAGVLQVRVSLGSKLQNDELVQLSSLSSGDTLAYNATTSRFENSQLKRINNTSLLGSGNITGASILNLVKIAVIGDSLSAQNPARTGHWVEYLSNYINQFGDRCEFTDLAKGGSTYYTAYTNALYGSNTMVQECIEQNPDIVIVMLGLNDVASGRTQAQIIADSTSLYQALRNGLPNAKIIYGSEVWYDNVNFTPTTLKNKGVIPIKWTLNSSGILANCFTSEIADNSVSSTIQTQATNWVALDTSIKALSTINGHFTYNHWKVGRLGLFIPDGLHHNAEGSKLIANDVAYGLLANSSISTLLPNFYSNAGSILGTSASTFETVLTSSGDGYTTVSGGDHDIVTFESGNFRKYNPDNWFMPYKGKIQVTNPTATLDTASYIKISFTNVAPNTEIFKSINGGSYTTTSTTTDFTGSADSLLPGSEFGLTGTYVMRFKVGSEVYGPVTITIQPSTGTGSDGVVYETAPTIAGLREVRVALGDSSINLTAGNVFTKTITANTTFTVTNMAAAGTTHSFVLELTNAGAYVITWWTGITWPGGVAPTLTVSGRDVLGFYTHDAGLTWTGFILAKDAK